MDLSVLCRSCMKEMTSRGSENFDKLAIDMFCFCTDVEISEDDMLPKQFCTDCYIQIDLSYKFIQKAHKVNIAFNNLLSRINTKVIIETQKVNCRTTNYNEIDIIKNYDSDNFYNEIMTEEEHSDTETDHKHSEDIKMGNTMQQELAISNKEDNKEKYSKNLVTNAKKINKDNHCPICRKKFKSKIWLSKHINKSHKENYLCNECPKLCSKNTELELLSTVHATPTTQQLLCAACSEQFASHRQLAAHAQTHDNAAAARPYICDYCASSFKTKHHLRGHINNLHTRVKPYLCNICGSSFSLLGNLKGHMVTHSTAKPFVCEQCPFATNSVYQLRRHHRRRHDPATNNTHRCPHCSKTFFDSAGLVRHVRRHTGARPYKCSHCDRGFIDSWKRKLHLMRSHKMLLSELQRLPIDPGTTGIGDAPPK